MTATAPSNGVGLQINGRSSDNIGQILFYANNGTTLHNYIQSRPAYFAINTETNTPIYFGTNLGSGGDTRMTITGAGSVGIGTTSPNFSSYGAGITVLSLATSTADKFSVLELAGNRGTGENQNGNIDFVNNNGTATVTSRITALNGASSVLDGILTFHTRTAAGALTERMRITSDGYARLSASSGGIQFNGDTAAANALDDYEEGTWTPTVSAESGSYTLITNARGRYTKVGRIVTLFYYFIVTTKGTGSGGAVLSNLPFTSLSSNAGDHYVGTGLNTSTADLHSVFLPQGSSSFTIYLNALDPITPTQGNSGSITYMT